MILQYGHRYFNDVNGDVWDGSEPTYHCENCGGEIYEGDDCYEIKRCIYCEDCVSSGVGILKGFGAEEREVNLPVCECCGEEIRGKFLAFREKNYCEDCLEEYGREILEDFFDVKPEIAPEPEE